MPRPLRSTAVAVVTVSAALVLASCSSSDDSDGPAKKGKAPAADAQGLNPQPASDVRQGGSLKLSVQQWISQYNSYQVDGKNGDAEAILEEFEPVLMPRDAQGVAHPDPDYLVSAAVTSTSP